MSLEEKPESQQNSESSESPADDFPRWVFDEDFAKAKERDFDELEFSPRKHSKKVVELMPLPRRKPKPEAMEPPVVGPDCEPAEMDDEVEEEAVSAGRSPEQLEKARRRQSAYIQKRRAQKKRRVFYSRIRSTFKVVSALVLLVLIYSAMTMSFWRFSPDQFTVHGNILITPKQIAPFISPLEGTPLYQINPMHLAETLQAEIPYAEHVYIRRRLFPVGLDVSIAEKPVWGVLYTIDSKAMPMSKVVASKPKAGDNPIKPLPAPKGKERPMMLLHWDGSATDLAPYTYTAKMAEALGAPVKVISNSVHVKSSLLDDYRNLVQLLSSRPKEAKLLYLNISNPNDVTAKFDGFNVRIGRMDGSLKERASRLFNVLEAARDHQEEILWVDLRWHQQVLFKKKSEAQLAAEKQKQAQSKDKEQPTVPEGQSAIINLAPESPKNLPAEPVSSKPLTENSGGAAPRH